MYLRLSCRFCTLSRGSSDGVAAVIRDSLLYAVTWQARKGRLEIPGSRRGASSYNSTRMRASSRIGITITTYIYVGESLESWEDPFTARNREFRVTLRGPRKGIGFGGCKRIQSGLYTASYCALASNLRVYKLFRCNLSGAAQLHVAAVSTSSSTLP
ncbi:hypothetical protein X777_09281 [Ooceraea biroi]|uniref:Uncharacterized protein n=1 Tax=Ooceraea biroi TaxID=2015173 RepID=A0A026W8J5_OOCBI|nr:hypothetical protein X777_09281 [Ooceraea biroi]